MNPLAGWEKCLMEGELGASGARLSGVAAISGRADSSDFDYAES